MDSMNITDEAIAVIGMSCRFPGAPDLDGYWRNLCEGKVSVTFLDRKDLAAAGVDHGLLRDPNYVPATYSLGDIDKFDAAFFGYAGSEAEKIDPQQRTFLECAWESLEDAGYTPLPGGGLEGKSVGVFAGSRISAYLEHACRGLKAGNGAEAFQCLVGNDKDYLCSRVSYKLNLNGPSLCVQTACSSSLSAVHVACENLRSGACDMALAGGVAIDVPQEKGYLFQEGMIFSRDGYCRPFDKNASGTVFSGGAGDLAAARKATDLRLLRKDFTVDGYQLHQAASWGADAVLLIAAVLSPQQCRELACQAHELGLEVLLEVHGPQELTHLCSEVDMVGVNNRDLRTFRTDIRASLQLAGELPADKVRVSESGIDSPQAVSELKKAGYAGFLIGERFMREDRPGEALRDFLRHVD